MVALLLHDVSGVGVRTMTPRSSHQILTLVSTILARRSLPDDSPYFLGGQGTNIDVRAAYAR
jgi:hypothetical protein